MCDYKYTDNWNGRSIALNLTSITGTIPHRPFYEPVKSVQSCLYVYIRKTTPVKYYHDKQKQKKQLTVSSGPYYIVYLTISIKILITIWEKFVLFSNKTDLFTYYIIVIVNPFIRIWATEANIFL